MALLTHVTLVTRGSRDLYRGSQCRLMRVPSVSCVRLSQVLCVMCHVLYLSRMSIVSHGDRVMCQESCVSMLSGVSKVM